MKKFALGMIGLATIASLTLGCDKCQAEKSQEDAAKSPAGYKTGVSNPMQPVKNAQAFEVLGFTFEAPLGATDIRYFIIANEIAEMDFLQHKVNYCYRASKQHSDISGIYETVKQTAVCSATLASGEPVTITIKHYVSGGCCATWKSAEVSYSLFARDSVQAQEFQAFAQTCAGHCR